MFSFEEYCEIYDAIQKKPSFEEQEQITKPNLTDRAHFPNLLIGCAIVSDVQKDEAYFETIINQSDIETLNKLLPYFSKEAKIKKTILNRIQLLQRYGDRRVKQQYKTHSISENTFFLYLCSWIDKKGFKSDSDFYNHAGILRQTFNKMKNNNTSVSREMALHLAAALELNYDEAIEFLKYAGYSFNPYSRREQIISFLMRKRQYHFYELEELLSILHEKTFLNWD